MKTVHEPIAQNGNSAQEGDVRWTSAVTRLRGSVEVDAVTVAFEVGYEASVNPIAHTAACLANTHP
jgi:hypothetical protein